MIWRLDDTRGLRAAALPGGGDVPSAHVAISAYMDIE